MADIVRALARRRSDMRARRRGALVPPRSLLTQTSSPSPSEFAAGGAVALQCCRLGDLRPGDRILDIGSGVGRVAIPLTGYLDTHGAYVGIDMWREGVQWCTKAITARFPNFTFRYLDVRHDRLNPSGTAAIEATPLPVADAAFDFVMLGAINHLTTSQLQALVGEAGRALRPGGTYVGTWFVFDDRSRALLPPVAAAVACPEEAMGQALAAASLHRRAFYPGSWRGAEQPVGFQTFQDVVVATKAGSEDISTPGGDGMPPVTSSP